MKHAILLSAAVLLVACNPAATEHPTTTSASSLDNQLSFTAATHPTTQTVSRLVGEVVVPPRAQRVLGPSVEARLVSWNVEVGAHVEVGEPLAALVSPELGDLSSVASELRRVIREREKNLTRLRESVKSGFKSSSVVYEGELSLSETRAQLQRVQDQLRVRNTDLRSGKAGEWEWVAPVAGTITQIECTPGGLYGAESRCITIVAKDAPRVRVDVSEHLANRVGDADVAASWTPVGSKGAIPLKLERRDATFDAQSRTLAYYFTAEQPLTAGASGLAELEIPAPQHAVSVPRFALVNVQGAPTVFVDNGKERPEAVAVEVIGREGDQVLVSGIAADARVVSRGAFALKSILAFE